MSPRSVRFGATVAGLAALSLVVAGCGSSDSPPASGAPAATGKIAVVASTNVWGSVAQAVGGDAVTVKSIIDDPSADPHSYEDKPEDATALAESRLVVFNGGGYDDFFTELVDTSGKDARRINAFEVSGKADGTNEHVWYDLPTVKAVADKIAEELGLIAPDKKGSFAGNARSFDAGLDELIARAAKIGADRPGAKVVFTEPIPEYLLEAAGLTNATPEEFSEAVEEETDPPAAAVGEITDLITGKQVAALVNNAQTETPVTKALKDAATKAGVPVVDVTETLPQGVTSYVDWMTGQVDALASALAKT
ncbi:MAG TPA: zinc ABC transporter substrate-binding protein [Actinophytocola sp.]|uniref:metal ABC transporter solute-binding protein, Zn/Mn family n=1 Tax=Actinophytocola sp. TaxID=1872138 RepID=UPI002DDCF31D|nr:zinc ABC transporter substrate-binding protein [Actinophytocola sp.]HEV2783260.1 zinc ABC transporter substrate-binding protein [Actinophytocola sp.]